MTTSSGGRPKVRTAQLSEALRGQLLDAFGTLWNSYRQLGLASEQPGRQGPMLAPIRAVSFPTFSRACRGLPIAPEELTAITVAWEIRRREPVAA